MANEPVQSQLRLHFVAFLDVLGFKHMVNAPSEKIRQENLTKLFRCHQSASVVFRDDANCSIIQFSDSIVITIPYDSSKFEWFASRIGDYQRLLLDEQLLCRGGIAYGEHFSNGSFTFSSGLIEAYKVESESSRYPRVVVSPELIKLIYPDNIGIPSCLIHEDDGFIFVDYLGLTHRKRPKHLSRSIEALVNNLMKNPEPSVREKGLWLANYSDAIFDSKHTPPKFTGKHTHITRTKQTLIK